MGVEKEYKFLLDSGSREALLRRIEWGEALLQESIFFDTAQGTLLAAGWALRLRFEAEYGVADAEDAVADEHPQWSRATLTLKGRTERSDALFERSEYEMEIGLAGAGRLQRGGWRASELPHHPVSDVLFSLRASDAEFEPIGSFRNLRFIKRLDGAEVCLDRSLAAGRGERVELEIETAGAIPESVRALLDDCECRPSPKGKFAWLLGL